MVMIKLGKCKENKVYINKYINILYLLHHDFVSLINLWFVHFISTYLMNIYIF